MAALYKHTEEYNGGKSEPTLVIETFNSGKMDLRCHQP
jgi:hypothetical protein